MTVFAVLALVGYVPLVLLFFLLLPGRTAVLAAFVGGWMFLPVTTIPLEGFPDIAKASVIAFGVLVGSLLYDRGAWPTLRPRWFDLPVLLWCLCPIASSLSNDLGLYDGLAVATDQVLVWGVPYVIGRVYCGDSSGRSALAFALLIGGVVYLPFILFETHQGPTLHHLLYGELPQPLRQSFRFGGWRPVIFMHHGLMTSLWMAAAAVTGLCLWRGGALEASKRWYPGVWVVALMLATVASRSVNAWTLLAAGVTVSWLVVRFRTRVPLVCLIAVAPLYIGARATGAWTAQQLVPIVSTVVSAERGQSIAYRFDIEARGLEKAYRRPVFGWGRWGRSFVYDKWEQRDLPFDSLWMLELGRTGFVGLLSLLLTLVLPAAMTVFRYPPRAWGDAGLAPTLALTLVLALYIVDSTVNAMVNPVFMLIAGSLPGDLPPWGSAAFRVVRGKTAV